MTDQLDQCAACGGKGTIPNYGYRRGWKQRHNDRLARYSGGPRPNWQRDERVFLGYVECDTCGGSGITPAEVLP